MDNRESSVLEVVVFFAFGVLVILSTAHCVFLGIAPV